MKSIRIQFVGNLPVSSGDNAIELGSDSDYLKVANLLREIPDAEQTLVWVRMEHHFKWLETLERHCGFSSEFLTEFERATPRLVLAQRWEREIPGWLTDKKILEHLLLEKRLPDEIPDVNRALLYPALGKLPLEFPSNKIGQLAERFAQIETKEFLEDNIMGGAWLDLVRHWLDQSDGLLWKSEYIERLQKNAEGLWADLTTWKILLRYPPEIQEFALSPSTLIFARRLPAGSLEKMALSPQGIETARDQISQFFDQTISETAKRLNLTEIVGYTSGMLIHEFEWLERLLIRRTKEVDGSIIAAIKNRFQRCPGLPEARLKNLDHWIMPPQPEYLTGSIDSSQWVDWARNQYFKYRWWQIQRNTVDSELELVVSNFSAWYCKNYTKIHADPTISAVQTLAQWRNQILQDTLSLILLVDNLPFFFWSTLEEALRTVGIYCHQTNAVFTPLPSLTSISKPQIVSGNPDQRGSDYLGMLKIQSGNSWDSRKVDYLSGINELDDIKDFSTPSVILLNYLAADNALHEDRNTIGISWEEQLSLLFQKLSQRVAGFARSATEAGQKISIYVCTDHGSTLILSDERTDAGSQLTKRLFPNEKYRSASLSKAEADSIPKNLWSLGIKFLAPMTTDQVHFIPRGHSTVASTKKGRYFSHGGASPEEVITPCGIFRLHKVERTLPQIRFTHFGEGAEIPKWYVKRIINVEVEILNNNTESCLLQFVELKPDVGKIRDFKTASLLPKKSHNIALSLYLNNDAIPRKTLGFTFQFLFGQETINSTIEIPVSIHSAMSGGLNLNDL
jgi:hypothetical protein